MSRILRNIGRDPHTPPDSPAPGKIERFTMPDDSFDGDLQHCPRPWRTAEILYLDIQVEHRPRRGDRPPRLQTDDRGVLHHGRPDVDETDLGGLPELPEQLAALRPDERQRRASSPAAGR